MIRIILNGCNGKMGKFVTSAVKAREDMEIAAGIDIFGECDGGFPVYASIDEVKEEADALIDFSNAASLNSVVTGCVQRKLPAVICTTGLSGEQIESINEASKEIPVFFSANMSIGVNLIAELSKTAAKFLGGSFDIEIVEAHHNQKVDAPSGTALMIADAIKGELEGDIDYEYNRQAKREKRPRNEIGIHSVRGGNIVGEHEVIFAGNDEIVKISHSARSRALFATGAVNAAVFIADKKPGMYSMSDMLK